MESFSQDDLPGYDEDIDDTFNSVGPDDELENHELIEARIADYQSASLRKTDPLEAVLGSINAGLLQMASQLAPRINNALTHGSNDPDSVLEIMPVLDAHLRVARQIDRFAQFEIRLSEIRARLAQSRGISMDPLQQFADLNKRRNVNLIPTSPRQSQSKPR